MKYLLASLAMLLVILTNPSKITAISDPLEVPNNKFGIHILYPEELSLAAKLVNSNGGDWGYVTIPIQSTDKNLEKWQDFMDKAKEIHLIPIIRLATFPVLDYWSKPDLYDAVDFSNFLDSLDWPVKNRYIIFFNEPNRAQEWSRELNPEEYAKFLNDAIDIFKERSDNFFVLNAGLDAAAPNNHILMDSFEFMRQMELAVPGIFNKLDGWDSHSYPNPDFRATPGENRKNTIYGFNWEKEYLRYLGVKDLPVFITETGWRMDRLNKEEIAGYYEEAFKNAWSNENIIAVTPFLLTAGTGQFEKFSFTMGNGEPLENFQKIVSIKKIAGKPELSQKTKDALKRSAELKKMKPVAEKNKTFSSLSLVLWKKVLKWMFYK